MWLCTQHGFCSIVRKPFPGQPGRDFQVRFRCQGDADNFARLLDLPADRIAETPRADYGWRIALSGEELGKLFGVLAKSIDYPNFKSRIGELQDQRDKLPIYGAFWEGMLDHQLRSS